MLPRAEKYLGQALGKAFGPATKGRLTVTLPSGTRVDLGHEAGPHADLELRSLRPVWRLATRGNLGLAESFMDGEIETNDLGAVLRFFLTNYAVLESAAGGIARSRLIDRLWHLRRANSLSGSRRNIAAHYDLGNAFYKLWLDPGMTYSSGIARGSEDLLPAMQDEKYRVILEQLKLEDGHDVLEIGCGWGGFAELAAKRGARVTALTLSEQQYAFARERLAFRGIQDRVDFRLQDYRRAGGLFDRIASIEMIEAVGEQHWPLYFKTVHERLKQGGTAVIQAITIDEKYFDSYRRQADFVQRYIFPGGMLPTVTRMREEALHAGLSFEVVERFGQSYARTLHLWREQFRAKWDEISRLGFDERFRRMWEYYLTYCEAGFEHGDVDVGIYKLVRA